MSRIGVERADQRGVEQADRRGMAQEARARRDNSRL